MSEYDDLLLEAYRGEIFGEAFFGALAEHCDDETRRAKLRVLQQVEVHTASQLRPLVDAAGLVAGDDGPMVADGLRLADGASGQPWPVFLEGLRSALPAFLAKFQRLREIASDEDDPVLADLVGHEQAIDQFAVYELAGKGDAALEVLQAHLDRSSGRDQVAGTSSNRGNA